jgi:hypothetical protein
MCPLSAPNAHSLPADFAALIFMKPPHFLSINSPAPRPLWLWRENKPESTPGHPLCGCQTSRAIPACHDPAPKRRLSSTKPFRPQKGNFMEMIPVIVLVVLGVPIALAIWLIVRAVKAGKYHQGSF